jgi:hypothetical protein
MVMPEEEEIMLWLCSSFYPKTPHFEDGYISPTTTAMIEAALTSWTLYSYIDIDVTRVTRT